MARYIYKPQPIHSPLVVTCIHANFPAKNCLTLCIGNLELKNLPEKLLTNLIPTPFFKAFG